MKCLLLITLLIPFSSVYSQKDFILNEQFDDNSKNWVTSADAKSVAVIENGWYKLKITGETGFCYDISLHLSPDKDFYIETKVKLRTGKLSRGFGLRLLDKRKTNDKKSYFYLISGDGSYKVYRHNSKDNSEITYKDWTDSDFIHQNVDKENSLAVKKAGNVYTFYINGEKVFEKKDLHFWGSRIGIFSSGPVHIDIDYLMVKQDCPPVNLTEEPIIAKKENLGANINSAYDELSPVISSDGKTLFFTVNGDPSNLGSAHSDDIYYSELNTGNDWSKRKNIGTPVNNESNNSVRGVTGDNHTLLLMHQYDEGGKYKGPGCSFSHRTEKGWTIPENIVIANYYDDAHENSNSISQDGKYIIFSIERKDSYGENDLYVSRRKKNGSWSEPENLGPVINTFGIEMSPYLAADGITLYFASNGHPGYGDCDIFMSKRLDHTWKKWSTPVNLGPAVNTGSWEAYFTIPAEGNYAYFSSRDNSLGLGDIFRIKVNEESLPQPVVMVYGKVTDVSSGQPLFASIVYHDLNTGEEIGLARTNPGDGSYKIILPYGKAYGFLAEKENFFSVADNIDLSEVNNFKELKRDLFLSPIETGKSINLNNVFFRKSLSDLLPGSYAELDRLVKLLQDNPGIKIQLNGHTDNQGDPAVNIKLSEDRVKAIITYLTGKGIAASRLSGKGFGGSQPVASNAHEETRRLNRRVEFVILEK
ncbi:MAG: OmpA family protein [Cytophagaceae bacterium]